MDLFTAYIWKEVIISLKIKFTIKIGVKIYFLFQYEIILFHLKIWNFGPGAVAHACNPNYLRDGDQEDFGSMLAQAKS
jgi:hypothetical protein